MLKTHTNGSLSGVIGMTTTQDVVFGSSMVGMKSGASGKATGAGTF